MNGSPGYYGKVVTHGDFVLRRLPPDFVDDWDRWLQAGLHHSRLALGAFWRDVYLNSPVWRFSTAAGVCGTQAMAGVLMPGVDRVGRYFPWTLAAPVVPPRPGSFARAAVWFDMLEELALDCLAPGFSLEAFDAALAGLGPLPAGGDWERGGNSMFWTGATRAGAPVSRSFSGMPAAQDFSALLAGVN